eukprot:1158362-Pelagomonas_calceolata.AAC.5
MTFHVVLPAGHLQASSCTDKISAHGQLDAAINTSTICGRAHQFTGALLGKAQQWATFSSQKWLLFKWRCQ